MNISDAFFDELVKISASLRSANHLKVRLGRLPIRVGNLIKKENEKSKLSSMVKQASDKKDLKTRILSGFAKVRPYAVEGVRAAVPMAMLGTLAGGEKNPKRLGKIMGVIGGTLGVTNRALKDWAEENKRQEVAKKLLKPNI